MARTIDTHPIKDGLHIYLSDNSSRWFARFKVGTAWKTKSTKESDKQQAIIKAIELKAEYKFKFDNNLPIFTHRKSAVNTFSVIAKNAIKRMEVKTANGSGKVVFKDYIQTLNKYHIPYFGEFNIKDIDEQVLMDFDEWRIDQFKQLHAKSTINTHNAALQRVFDEAVIGKIITMTELPAIKNKGQGGYRRAAFTRTEYQDILVAAKAWVSTGKKQVTKDTRRLLYYYIQFAVMTGMRPGKEIEHLTWSDVHDRTDKNGLPYTMITVRKGKTTLYTGTREIVCKAGVGSLLESIKNTLDKSEKDDLIFTLPDGKVSAQIGRNFGKLLDDNKLKKSTLGERTLYSLRHSYITWELHNKTNLTAIAKQCGTSVEMIEYHYSHVTPSMFADELSGAGSSLDLTNTMDKGVIDFLSDDGNGGVISHNSNSGDE